MALSSRQDAETRAGSVPRDTRWSHHLVWVWWTILLSSHNSTPLLHIQFTTASLFPPPWGGNEGSRGLGCGMRSRQGRRAATRGAEWATQTAAERKVTPEPPARRPPGRAPEGLQASAGQDWEMQHGTRGAAGVQAL